MLIVRRSPSSQISVVTSSTSGGIPSNHLGKPQHFRKTTHRARRTEHRGWFMSENGAIVAPDLPDDPVHVGTERDTLVEFLDYYRSVLLRKAAGLSQAQLAIRVATSPLTIGGLIKHMALVEDGWFPRGMGRPPARRAVGERRLGGRPRLGLPLGRRRLPCRGSPTCSSPPSAGAGRRSPPATTCWRASTSVAARSHCAGSSST